MQFKKSDCKLKKKLSSSLERVQTVAQQKTGRETRSREFRQQKGEWACRTNLTGFWPRAGGFCKSVPRSVLSVRSAVVHWQRRLDGLSIGRELHPPVPAGARRWWRRRRRRRPVFPCGNVLGARCGCVQRRARAQLPARGPYGQPGMCPLWNRSDGREVQRADALRRWSLVRWRTLRGALPRSGTWVAR